MFWLFMISAVFVGWNLVPVVRLFTRANECLSWEFMDWLRLAAWIVALGFVLFAVFYS